MNYWRICRYKIADVVDGYRVYFLINPVKGDVEENRHYWNCIYSHEPEAIKQAKKLNNLELRAK